MNDPLSDLKAVIALAEGKRKLSNMLVSVRQLHESDTDTLQRLLDERAAVVKVLEKKGVPHQSFNYDYRGNMIEVLRTTFGDSTTKKESAE